VANPGQEDDDANGVQDACQPGLDFDGDGTLNEADCAPSDDGAWSRPGAPVRLFAWRAGDDVVIGLEPPDPLGQRPYASDVALGALAALRANGDDRDALCQQAGWPGPELVLTPAPDQDLYFRAWPWNGCGPVDGGGLPLSRCR
jgi:hypothetical protein